MSFMNNGPVFNDEEVTHDYRNNPDEHGEFWYGYALGAQRAIVRYERLVDQLQSLLEPTTIEVPGEDDSRPVHARQLVLHEGIGDDEEDDYVPDDEEDDDGSPFMG